MRFSWMEAKRRDASANTDKCRLPMIRLRKGAARVASSRADASAVRLTLLGGFAMTVDDMEVSLSHAVQRLLAFLALHRRSLDRVYVAGSLWGDTCEQRAHANLRATISRARIPDADLVRVSATHIAIGPAVDIDYHAAIGRARTLLEGQDTARTPQETNQFALDLLPAWNEEWVQLERERLRQLRLHALEACCYRFIAVGDTARAIDFGLAAVASAPLRESAQRSLMSAHIAEGNHAEALSVLDAFRRQLWESCGLRPSTLMEELVAPLRSDCDVA